MQYYIEVKARFISEKWANYIAIKDTNSFLEQRKSEKGTCFKELHVHIMNIQGWLRHRSFVVAVNKITAFTAVSVEITTDTLPYGTSTGKWCSTHCMNVEVARNCPVVTTKI